MLYFVPVGIIFRIIADSTSTNSFLRRANTELFAVHGLFAMVIAFNENQKLPSYTVNTSQSPRGLSLLTQPQMQLGAPLISTEVDTGHHSKRPKTPKRRQRRTSSTASPSKRRVIMNNTFEGVFADRTRAKKQSFSGAMKDMISGSGKAERDFMKRANAKEVDEVSSSRCSEKPANIFKQDALYLMIVNNPPGGDPSMASMPDFVPPSQKENPWTAMPQNRYWNPASDGNFPGADSNRPYSDHIGQVMDGPPPAYQGGDENKHQWM
jgi:hypothetical protein